MSSNSECVYADKRKAGPKKGHIRDLHSKIQSLENSLGSLSSQLDEYRSSGQQRSPFGSASSPDVGHRGNRSNSLSHSHLSTSFASTDSPQSHVEDDLLASVGFPPYRHLADLVDLFFESVTTWLPFITHELAISLLKDPMNINEPDQILLHALIVSGMRFWKGPEEMRQQYLRSSKQRVQAYALSNANIRCLQALVILAWEATGDADFAQAMNLLTLLARNISHLGLGGEPRFDLGLSIDAPAGMTQSSKLAHPETWYEQEERRRLFWVAYALDRYANTSTSSDFKINESEVNRPLPCRFGLWIAGEPVETRWYRTDDPFEMTVDNPQNLGSFSYLCEVTRIMTRIHEFVRRPLDFYSATDVQRWRESYNKLDHQLSSWLSSLPGEPTRSSGHVPSQSAARYQASKWITLQSGFILASIRLHSVAGYPPMSSELFKPSQSAMQKCLTAASSMLSAAKDVVDQGMLGLLGPPFAGALWVTARLLLVHASVPGHQLDPSIHFYISTLEKMSEYWPVSKAFAYRLTCMMPHAQPTRGLKSLEDLRRYVIKRCSSGKFAC